jgi:hypothetical protein
MPENVSRDEHTPEGTGTNPKWTVMVYLAGDNSLTSNCITVLQQLEAVEYNSSVSVLACFDSNTPWPKGSRYFAINRKRRMNDEELDWEIYNDLIIPKDRNHEIKTPDFCQEVEVRGRPMGRTDVAEGLKRFLHWAMKQSESEHYMLVLYGHGPVVAGKTFLERENPISALRMKDIPKLLEPHFGGTRRLDILAFQNCAMNGIETAYEVKDQVDYMIGSQGLVLSYGWPYDRIVGTLVDNPTDPPSEITAKILKVCARHMLDFSVMDRSSEQSACNLSKLRNETNIKDAIAGLSAELQAGLKFKTVQSETGLEQRVLEYPPICDAVRLARLEAQSFWGETFVDVYDFCERLLKKCNETIIVHNGLASGLALDGSLEPKIRSMDLMLKFGKIIRHCMNVMDQVEEMVPYSYYVGSELQYSHGLSIYFPWSLPVEPYSFAFNEQRNEHALITAFETYSSYDFAKDSDWADFLKSFYRATLRRVRRADRKFTLHSDDKSLSFGLVQEEYTPSDTVLTTEYLRKTDSNTAPVDNDVWSSVKNYPRRDYVSPADCPRKVDTGGIHRPGSSHFPNSLSPPVSYLGWNFCEFLADVIRGKPNNGNKIPAKKARHRRKKTPAQ